MSKIKVHDKQIKNTRETSIRAKNTFSYSVNPKVKDVTKIGKPINNEPSNQTVKLVKKNGK